MEMPKSKVNHFFLVNREFSCERCYGWMEFLQDVVLISHGDDIFENSTCRFVNHAAHIRFVFVRNKNV